MPRPKRDVLAAAQEASDPPTVLSETHILACVIKAEGNNLFSVIQPDGNKLLVELAAKLRNTFWIKRNGYVIVDTEALAERDNKLGGEIITVIMNEKKWRKMDYWPKEFAKKVEHDSEEDSEEESNMGKMPPSESEEDDENED
jgi:probable RNA-binding protein EIF1AD